jgi:hypothetical protein
MFASAIQQRVAFLMLGLAATSVPTLSGQSQSLVDIRELTPRELRSAAFVLPTRQTIRVDAVGAEPRNDRRKGRWWSSGGGDNDEWTTWPAAAWILNAATREVVWDMREARTERSGDGLRTFSGTVDLPAGVYIAYFGSYVATSVSYSGNFDLASLLRSRRRHDARYEGPYVDDGSFRQFTLEIKGAGRAATTRDVDSAQRALTSATVISLRPDSPSTSLRAAFSLSRPVDLEIYAIGELRRDDAFDYGWLLNADTRRRVWQMEYRRTEDGGGAHKNRMVHDTIHLPAGRYVAYYVLDDSHDPGEWNAMPPVDPEAWGLTLRATDPAEQSAVRSIPWEPVPAGQTIVSLTEVGDNELRREGFTLKRPMDVRVYALGEGADPGQELNDYAWIVDATSRRRVWTMKYDETEDAGGATKNRLFDGTLHLAPGSYVVYYKSDDSHSFEKWNDGAPAESHYWGVSVFPASGPLDRAMITPLEGRPSNAIAELLRVRSGRHPHTLFTLARPATVRVVAIGEGTGGEMNDFGWIENAETGDTVWEMTYRSTTNAGGAEKNRLFDGTVRLPAGRYELRYETDGSHAYGDWNDDPPDDPEGWGIAVLPESGG